jgi:hypothetical protein
VLPAGAFALAHVSVRWREHLDALTGPRSSVHLL